MSREDFNYSSILVQDIMTRALITVNLATTALQVAKMMEQGGIGAILVQDNGNPVGIVTDRDFATRVAANNLPFDTSVEKIMSSPLISIDPDSDLWVASDLMSTRNVRKLPVIEDDKVVGILTSSDLVKHIADH